MTEAPKKFEIADDTEMKARAREVQVLLNIVHPDPEYQPFILTDEASIFDAVATEEDDMLKRLAAYFRGDFSFSLRQPIWKLVDEIKSVIQTGPTTGAKWAALSGLTRRWSRRRDLVINDTFVS